MHPRLAQLALAAVVALCLALAACSEKSSGKGTGTTNAGNIAPGTPAADPVASGSEKIDLAQYPPESRFLYRFPCASGTQVLICGGHNSFPTHLEQSRWAVDFQLAKGTPLLAVREGVVIRVVQHFSESGVEERLKPRANLVEIRHDDGTVASYGHLQQNGARVRVGQRVKAGEVIGLNGDVGFTAEPHLHFQVNRADGSGQSIPIFFAYPTGPLRLIEGIRYTVPGYDVDGRALAFTNAGADASAFGPYARLCETLAGVVACDRVPDLGRASAAFTAYLREHETELRRNYLEVFKKSLANDPRAAKEMDYIMQNSDISAYAGLARILDPNNPHRELVNQGLTIYYRLSAKDE